MKKKTWKATISTDCDDQTFQWHFNIVNMLFCHNSVKNIFLISFSILVIDTCPTSALSVVGKKTPRETHIINGHNSIVLFHCQNYLTEYIQERVQPVGLIPLSCNWEILHNEIDQM